MSKFTLSSLGSLIQEESLIVTGQVIKTKTQAASTENPVYPEGDIEREDSSKIG